MQTLYLRSVDDKKQAPPLSQRPGYWEAKEQKKNFSNGEKRTTSSFYPLSERKRLHDKIDPSLTLSG